MSESSNPGKEPRRP